MKIVNKRVKLFWLLLFGFLLACNVLLPPVSDDFAHQEICKKGFMGAVENYMTTNARFGQCLLCWFAGGMDPLAFDFVNAVLGTLFVFLLFVLIEGRRPRRSLSDYGELSILLIAILTVTMFGSVFLWMSGATNYLWGYVLIAAHWIPYRLYWRGKDAKVPVGGVVLFFFLSLFAGWSSEQIGIMSLLIHVGLLVYGKAVLHKRFPLWAWAGVLGIAGGFLILYFAPGISVRADDSSTYMSIGQLLSSGIPVLFKRTILTLGYASSKWAFDVLMFVLTGIFMSRFPKTKPVLKCFLLVALVFVVAFLHADNMQVTYFYIRILLSMAFVIVSLLNLVHRRRTLLSLMFLVYFMALLSTIQILGHLPERAKCAQSLWLVAMSIYAIKEFFSLFFHSRWHYALLAVCSGVVLWAFADYCSQQQELAQMIAEQKHEGNSCVRVPARLYASWYPNLGDWANPSDDSSHWLNKDIARHYGMDEFVVEYK